MRSEVAEHPVIRLANDSRTNQVTGFCRVATSLDGASLARMYRQERAEAPRRRERGKSYFVGHVGVPGSGTRTTRQEEHLAIALFNSFGLECAGLTLPEGGSLRFLDYQFPLKAQQSDAMIGSIDLLGLLPDDRLAVVELKFLPSDKRRASAVDTPLRALIEGLAYCAILEENLDAVRREALEKLGQRTAKGAPGLVVLANADYWQRYREVDRPGESWTAEIGRLAGELERELGLSVRFLGFDPAGDATWGYSEGQPTIAKELRLVSAW